MELKKGYKQTDIGVIPSDWEVDDIGNVVSITTGAKNTQDRIEDGNYPFFVRSQTVERINSYSFDGEGVLTAGDGVGTGKVFHYINGKFDFHQRVYLMSGFASRLNGYFFYLYFKNNFYGRIMQMTAKSSVDSVRREMISKMKLPLPPLAEQTAIATALSDADALITRLEKLIAKKKLIKQGAMQELLKPKKGWIEKKLGEIAEIKKGEQINRDSLNESDSYPVMNGGISPSGFTSNWNAESNTIIISEGGNSCGYVNFIRTNFWQGGHCYSIVTKINRLFLYYFLKFNEKSIMALRVGSGLPNIQRNRLYDFNISIPDENAQDLIANTFSDFDKEIEAMEKKLINLRMIKVGMMQNLLTGKIRLV